MRLSKKRKAVIYAVIIILALFLILRYMKVWNSWKREADEYHTLAQTEKDWIIHCQEKNGLILSHHWDEDADGYKQTVIPYFSNIAAAGLLSGEPSEKEILAAEKYLLWYLEHINTEEEDPINGAGTIYDYKILRNEDGTIEEVSTNQYDSVDSYAATFLVLARMYMEKGNINTIMLYHDELRVVMEALLRTIDHKGLSVVKQDYPINYLMDNAEVYQGLMSAVRIEEKLDPGVEIKQRLEDAAYDLKNSVENNLWNEEEGYYEIGISDNYHFFRKFPMQKFYPDSTVQLFPIIFGLIDRDEERSQKLYWEFVDTWDLANMGYRRIKTKRSYWCALICASAKMGDEDTVKQFIGNYQNELERKGRRFPYHTGESGWVALACGELENYYRTRFW